MIYLVRVLARACPGLRKLLANVCRNRRALRKRIQGSMDDLSEAGENARKCLDMSGNVWCAHRTSRSTGHTHPTSVMWTSRELFLPTSLRCRVPFLCADTRLTEDSRQKVDAGITAMLVRQDHSTITTLHELMAAANEGAVEPQLPQTPDELTARNRTKAGHPALRGSSRATSPIAGRAAPRWMLKRIQSSSA